MRNALRLAGALGWYWWRTGRFSEGESWLESLLALSGNSAPTQGLARVLFFLGWMKFVQGGFESRTPRAYFAKSLEQWRILGDKRGIALSASLIGFWERQHGQ